MESKGTSISVDLQRESMLCIITETNLENALLDFVKQGVFHKHDKMTLLPIDKEVVIRSIQMQDKDFEEAGYRKLIKTKDFF